MPTLFTAETLLLNDIFLEYCLNPGSENARKWQALVAENKIPEETIKEARAMLGMLTPTVGDAEIEQEIAKLKDVFYERALKRRKIVSKLSVAAGLAAVAFVIIFFTARSGEKKDVYAGISAVEHHTGVGEQKRIMLPDGTIVILNSNTDLSYRADYNNRERKVYLSGYAFFKVAKNMAKPFSVINGQFSTTALGTSFYVKGDSSNDFSVKLLEGKVKINSEKINTTEYLEPGEEIRCSKKELRFIKHHYDTTYLNRWVSGKIVFRKTPVTQALAILRQWYDVEIVDDRNKRPDILINGTYENVSLEDILKVISFSLDFKYRYEGNRVIIE